MKYTIKNDPKDSLVTLGLSLTLFPWITMLAVGALGHRLHVSILANLDFIDILLIQIALYPVRGSGFTKKIAEPIN